MEDLFSQISELIQSARKVAVRNVNTLQVLMNYEIGRRIVQYEQKGAMDITDLVGKERLQRGEFEQLIRQKSSAKWHIPHSDKTRISESTLRRWVENHKASNCRLEALCPKTRQDKGDSRSIDDET